MDTATHFAMGFGLAGLAYVDPVVASDPRLAIAVMVATIIGSQAPDSDTILRLKDNATYVRNHRGITHSLPFMALWIALISGFTSLLLHQEGFWHILLWTAVAVGLHVFTDLFNTYGTQAVRPFSETWISWNIINIFDPFIFGTHIIALLLWLTGLVAPAPLFVTLYAVIAVYYVWRTLTHWYLTRKVEQMDIEDGRSPEPDGHYVLIPTISLRRWHVVHAKKDGSYRIGWYSPDKLIWIDSIQSMSHPAIEASRNHRDIRALLYFSSYTVSEVEKTSNGYIVRWADVRYRHRRQYPFVAVVVMDENFNAIDSYVGWLSPDKMNDRISLHMS
ncbi:metal-dependent hydrolase [Paenibacillus wulumuqiensis]|uniref:metal-dependent hydrolase n=1 Tax=Paenibacillus wulumuqiensis TaxID=1567107 RepID=UPI0006198EDB|nr:metal-dependent hydrolase [Paenibacillus wulumuqiensis]